MHIARNNKNKDIMLLSQYDLHVFLMGKLCNKCKAKGNKGIARWNPQQFGGILTDKVTSQLHLVKVRHDH